MSTADKLVRMANQIALNFEATGHDNAVAATADHIQAFWDPRMKGQLFDLLGTGAALSDVARAAADRLARVDAH